MARTIQQIIKLLNDLKEGEGIIIYISHFPESYTMLKPIEAFPNTLIITIIQDKSNNYRL